MNATAKHNANTGAPVHAPITYRWANMVLISGVLVGAGLMWRQEVVLILKIAAYYVMSNR